MKGFHKLVWDPTQCRKELEEFRQLLAGSGALKERDDVLPFFKARPHLGAFIGSYDPWGITNYDLVASEYPLGDFTCDLVVGDSGSRNYGFVEFEDAAPGGIFVKKPKKSAPEWSPRFERGYSQIIDWFWRLHEIEQAPEYTDRFGPLPIDYFGLLIVGRTEAFEPREVRRLAWRQGRTVVNSRRIYCRTFDQLCDDLSRRLNTFPQAIEAKDQIVATDQGISTKDAPPAADQAGENPPATP